MLFDLVRKRREGEVHGWGLRITQLDYCECNECSKTPKTWMVSLCIPLMVLPKMIYRGYLGPRIFGRRVLGVAIAAWKWWIVIERYYVPIGKQEIVW